MFQLPLTFCFQCLGYVCCLESAVLGILQKCTGGYYQPVAEDQQELQQRELQHLDDNATALTHNYKPATVPKKTEEPSYLHDDIQPCSSKSADPYRIA